jgi:hypothetical protein
MGKPTYEPFPEDAGHYASAADGASSSSALAIDMGPGSSPVILASMERREPRDLVAKLVFSLAGLGLLVSGIVLWTTGNLRCAGMVACKENAVMVAGGPGEGMAKVTASNTGGVTCPFLHCKQA